MVLVLLAGCGTSGSTAAPTAAPAASGGKRLQVIATTSLVGDAVRQVAGNAADVTVLLPLGADAHSYEPTPQDIVMVSKADVVFVNGFGLEAFMDRLLANAGNIRTVSVSDGITPLKLADEDHQEHDEATAESGAAHDDEHSGDDPHVWFNPLNVAVWTTNIATTLGALDSANAATYTANAQAYSTKLTALDATIKERFAGIPAANHKLVTDHDTFGYLAAQYGFELVGAVIPSASSTAEPSAQQLAELQQAVKQYHVKAIFVASEVNPAIAQRIAADTGVKLVPVFVESLTDQNGPADTYLTFMEYNTTAIADALR